MSNPIKLNLSTSNYLDFGKNIESLNMLTASTNIGRTNLSIGLGSDTNYNFDNRDGAVNKFAIEAKAKYNINENLNTQARFRKIGDAEQYRITFGGNYNFDKKNSIYSSAHLTTKCSNGDWKTNTGAWLGYTHKFENCSISSEIQQNIPFNGKIEPSSTMINVILNIPI